MVQSFQALIKTLSQTTETCHFSSSKDMAKLSLSLLIILFFFRYISGTAESAVPQNPSATDFIKASCRATLYPALCVHCLSTFANKIQQNERELAQAALSVSLGRARSTAMFVSKMFKASGLNSRVYQAVRDCVDNMGDSVDQLSRSAKELGHMGRVSGQDFMWHASNVQTWVSAALTDESTCLDGFSGHAMDGNVKAAIKNKVVYVAKVTSNALALVNRFAARHRAGAATGSVP